MSGYVPGMYTHLVLVTTPVIFVCNGYEYLSEFGSWVMYMCIIFSLIGFIHVYMSVRVLYVSMNMYICAVVSSFIRQSVVSKSFA